MSPDQQFTEVISVRVKGQIRELDVHYLPCTVACFWKEILNKAGERRGEMASYLRTMKHGRYIWALGSENMFFLLPVSSFSGKKCE